ncbi:MAG: hypothetical protein JSW66_11795 [Phycisphaerales bacterium]|nr:MAG: hypothetical protein JSW66_11795 [Phycisphaerales bacterium]
MGRKKLAESKRNREQCEPKRHPDRAYSAFDEILELVSSFCHEYLTEDYRELCEDLTWAAYEEALPLEKGKPAGWASGIVYALGRVNFLQDPNQSPHMSSAQIAEGFGISQATMMAKARIIRDELDLMPLHPEWCIPAMLEDNPLVWILDVDGVPMDIRGAPRGAQEEAYRLGLIPYIPADRQEPEPPPQTQGKIIQFPAGQNSTPAPESAREPEDDEPTLFEGPGQ